MENHLNLHMFRIGVICSKGQFDRGKKYQYVAVIHVIEDPKYYFLFQNICFWGQGRGGGGVTHIWIWDIGG